MASPPMPPSPCVSDAVEKVLKLYLPSLREKVVANDIIGDIRQFTSNDAERIRVRNQNEGKQRGADELVETVRRRPNSIYTFIVSLERNDYEDLARGLLAGLPAVAQMEIISERNYSPKPTATVTGIPVPQAQPHFGQGPQFAQQPPLFPGAHVPQPVPPQAHYGNLNPQQFMYQQAQVLPPQQQFAQAGVPQHPVYQGYQAAQTGQMQAAVPGVLMSASHYHGAVPQPCQQAPVLPTVALDGQGSLSAATDRPPQSDMPLDEFESATCNKLATALSEEPKWKKLAELSGLKRKEEREIGKQSDPGMSILDHLNDKRGFTVQKFINTLHLCRKIFQDELDILAEEGYDVSSDAPPSPTSEEEEVKEHSTDSDFTPSSKMKSEFEEVNQDMYRQGVNLSKQVHPADLKEENSNIDNYGDNVLRQNQAAENKDLSSLLTSGDTQTSSGNIPNLSLIQPAGSQDDATSIEQDLEDKEEPISNSLNIQPTSSVQTSSLTGEPTISKGSINKISNEIQQQLTLQMDESNLSQGDKAVPNGVHSLMEQTSRGSTASLDSTRSNSQNDLDKSSGTRLSTEENNLISAGSASTNAIDIQKEKSSVLTTGNGSPSQTFGTSPFAATEGQDHDNLPYQAVSDASMRLSAKNVDMELDNLQRDRQHAENEGDGASELNNEAMGNLPVEAEDDRSLLLAEKNPDIERNCLRQDRQDAEDNGDEPGG